MRVVLMVDIVDQVVRSIQAGIEETVARWHPKWCRVQKVADLVVVEL